MELVFHGGLISVMALLMCYHTGTLQLCSISLSSSLRIRKHFPGQGSSLATRWNNRAQPRSVTCCFRNAVEVLSSVDKCKASAKVLMGSGFFFCSIASEGSISKASTVLHIVSRFNLARKKSTASAKRHFHRRTRALPSPSKSAEISHAREEHPPNPP